MNAVDPLQDRVGTPSVAGAFDNPDPRRFNPAPDFPIEFHA